MRRLTTLEFISRAKQKYPNEGYDYAKVDYINSRSKVCIICPIHEEFWKLANSFLKDSGCPKCGQERVGLKRRDSLNDFIEKANIVHNNKYDYSLVKYDGAHNKVEIICPVHGSFLLTPGAHIYGNGCPRCNESKGERLIHKFLLGNKIEYNSQYKLPGKFSSRNFIKVDFYIPSYNCIIEYNGRQHYQPIKFSGDSDLAMKNFGLQRKRDEEVREYCESNSITLLEIPHSLEEDEVINKLNQIFK